MNRIIYGLTAAAMVGTLTACSGRQGGTKAATPSGSEAAGSTESITQQGEIQAGMKATVIWRAFDDQFQNGFRIIMQNEAEELGGITLGMQGVASDISTASSKLEMALSKRADVVVICAPDKESIENMIKKCDADGVPVVFFNMEPIEDTIKRYGSIWYAGAQTKQPGEMCAQALINYWNDEKDIVNRNGDGRLQLIILQGEIGRQDMTLRTDTYKGTLKKNGTDHEILACDTVNQNQAQTLDKMNAQIITYGIDGIEDVLCNNDSMAMDVVQTCISNDYNSGDAEKFVPIMSIDANIDALEVTKAGPLLGTVLNNRKSQSGAIINVIKVVHTGAGITEDVADVDCAVDGKYVWVPYVIVDGSNLSTTLEDMLAVTRSEQGAWRKQMEEYRLKISNASRSFPGVRVLDNVELAVKPGSVHALIDENGADKSILMKCLFDLYYPDSGTIKIDGQIMDIKSPNNALKSGISMIHQELNPVPYRNVVDGIWAGRFQTKGIVMNGNQMMKETKNLFRDLDFDMDVTTFVENLSVSQIQVIEIARAISYNVEIIITNEPTSSLATAETQYLFKTIDELGKEGHSIIYISHELEEIFETVDEIMVMRDGQYVGTWDIKDTIVDQLIEQMVERKMDERFPVRGDMKTDEVMLRVENSTNTDPRSFRNVSFNLYRGEILGIGGLVGAQRTKLIEVIFGLRRIAGGELTVNGEAVVSHSPQDVIRNGFALLTEERRATGIIPVLSAWDSTPVVACKRLAGNVLGYIYTKKLSPSVDKTCTDLDVRVVGVKMPIKSLLGGNQRKVLTGKWLLTDCGAVMLDEPTRGVDVGIKYEIYRTIQDLVKKGKAAIMASSKMPELLGMLGRIMIIRTGKQTSILGKKEAAQIEAMRCAIQLDDRTGEGVSVWK